MSHLLENLLGGIVVVLIVITTIIIAIGTLIAIDKVMGALS